MRHGPKQPISVAPLGFKGYPRDRARRRIKFIESFCVIPRGKNAGKNAKIQGFQREILTGAFAPGVRTALVSIPRANGKTMLAAFLAIAELFVGPPSAEVIVVASDQRQASIVLKYAKRIVEMNPVLAERVHVYADHLYLPENDATLTPPA
jgi:phage terminase large subunit-like protein